MDQEPAFKRNETRVNKGEDSDNDGTFAKDASNNLSYEKLKYTIDRRHPKKTIMNQDGSISLEKWPLCKTRTGSHGCSKQSRSSDF